MSWLTATTRRVTLHLRPRQDGLDDSSTIRTTNPRMSPAPESSAAVTPNLIAVSNPTAPAIIAAMAAIRAPSNAPLLVPTLVRSRARSTSAKTATASEPSGAGLLLKREARVGAGTEEGGEGGGGGGGGGGAFPGG